MVNGRFLLWPDRVDHLVCSSLWTGNGSLQARDSPQTSCSDGSCWRPGVLLPYGHQGAFRPVQRREGHGVVGIVVWKRQTCVHVHPYPSMPIHLCPCPHRLLVSTFIPVNVHPFLYPCPYWPSISICPCPSMSILLYPSPPIVRPSSSIQVHKFRSSGADSSCHVSPVWLRVCCPFDDGQDAWDRRGLDRRCYAVLSQTQTQTQTF